MYNSFLIISSVMLYNDSKIEQLFLTANCSYLFDNNNVTFSYEIITKEKLVNIENKYFKN